MFSDLYQDLYGKNKEAEKVQLNTGSDSTAGPSEKNASDKNSLEKNSSERMRSSVDAMDEAMKALKEMEEKLRRENLDRLMALTPYTTGSSGTFPEGIARASNKGETAAPGTNASREPGQNNGSSSMQKEPDGNSAQAEGSMPEQMTVQQAAQEQQKALETDPMEDLNELIGLTGIKHDVKELYDFTRIQKLRKEAGMKTVPVSMHLVFTGNPGTGKTTVARILARLYKQIGVLSKGQLVECDRSGLVAGYVGQTAVKTQKKIEEAMGGVLFIDEAYALARNAENGTDFGQEAIDTLLKAMEDHREDFVVIVAGYTGPMETFIQSNPGLKSRFNKFIEFPDYTVDELVQIFDLNCSKYQYVPDPEARDQIKTLIMLQKAKTPENFANARAVRNLFETIITNQARRVAQLEKPTVDEMQQITLEDLRDEEAEGDEGIANAPGTEG